MIEVITILTTFLASCIVGLGYTNEGGRGMGMSQGVLEGRMSGEVVSIESEFVKFSISHENGCYYFLDK